MNESLPKVTFYTLIDLLFLASPKTQIFPELQISWFGEVFPSMDLSQVGRRKPYQIYSISLSLQNTNSESTHLYSIAYILSIYFLIKNDSKLNWIEIKLLPFLQNLYKNQNYIDFMTYNSVEFSSLNLELIKSL